MERNDNLQGYKIDLQPIRIKILSSLYDYLKEPKPPEKEQEDKQPPEPTVNE